MAVLKAAGVKLIDKTLQMCYDDNGFKYDIPIFVINDPTDYKIQDLTNKKFEDKTISVIFWPIGLVLKISTIIVFVNTNKVVVRCGPDDATLKVKTNDPVSTMTEMYIEHICKPGANVRL